MKDEVWIHFRRDQHLEHDKTSAEPAVAALVTFSSSYPEPDVGELIIFGTLAAAVFIGAETGAVYWCGNWLGGNGRLWATALGVTAGVVALGGLSLLLTNDNYVPNDIGEPLVVAMVLTLPLAGGLVGYHLSADPSIESLAHTPTTWTIAPTVLRTRRNSFIPGLAAALRF